MKQIPFNELLTIIAFGIGYFIAHQIAFFFPDSKTFIMLIWPAAGIGLSALLLKPYKIWLYYILTFYIAGVSADVILAHRSIYASFGFMTANMVESAGCAYLIRKTCKDIPIRFSTTTEVFSLLAGTIFINSISSIIGAGTSTIVSKDSFSDAWLSWYISDGLGILLTTPFFISFITIKQQYVSLKRNELAETFFFLLIWTAICIIVFTFPVVDNMPFAPHPYMLIALLLWPAFRLRFQTVALSLVILTTISVTGSFQTTAPVSPLLNEKLSLLHLQVYIGFITFIGYYFSAIANEKRSIQQNKIENEYKYKNLFNQTNEGLMIMSLDGKILEVNSVFASMHGYKTDELRNMSINMLDTHANGALAGRQDIIDTINKGETVRFEVEHRHKSGHTFPLSVTSSLIEIESQQCYLAFHQDITERKKIEQELKERTQFTESLINLSPDVLYIYDIIDQHNIYTNDGIRSILGYSTEEIKNLGNKLIAELMHPDDFQNYLSTTIPKYGQAKDNERIITQYRMRHKDGTWRWLLSNEIIYTRTEDGSPKQIFGMIHNISDLKEKELKLEESEYFFKESQRIANIGSYRLFIQKDLWDASDGLLQIFGIDNNYPRTTQGWLQIVHPDDHESMGKYLAEEVIGKRKLFNKEYRIVRFSDKSIRWVSGQGKVEIDSNGAPVYMIGTIQDITDRRNAETIIQNAQKLESLGILAGGIAHDFNNLMGGIFGYIDIAIDASTNENVISYLTKAEKTIDRAKGLTAQLLTFAKGGAPIQKIIPLPPLIKETVLFALSGSNVRSRFDISEDLWNCNIDKNQISQVFDNVVINAVHAMPEGGEINITAVNITISETSSTALSTGNYVKIAFKDSGIGIQKDNLHNIFVPFYTTKPSGHGLGLATCYSIILRHGGTIEVESEFGKGTTFSIYIPATLQSSDIISLNTIEHKGKGHFLLMDDEPVMRETISVMLESFGYKCITTAEGNQTINVLRKSAESNQKFEGVMLDLTIPGGLGGKETLREIRKFDSKIPIFVVSGYADDPIMKDPCHYGFTDSICKPFRSLELEAMLEKYFSKTEHC